MTEITNDREEEARVTLGLPLDPAQLVRIEAVHRGFLYQHLYAAACLLTAGRQPNNSVIIERDEDIELLSQTHRRYIQVKTRSRPLQPGDIEGILERFEELREEHTEGRRTGIPIFRIVANVELGPQLLLQVDSEAWPEDVEIITPDAPSDALLPPAWPDLEAALRWCIIAAANVPFGSLAPETLVWKLAARAQYAASGNQEHRFYAEQMPALLEQLLVQLQSFPEPPLNYRPQINEPPLLSESRIRILTGFSGAGKTAWASQAALHCPNSLVYYDTGNMPAESAASTLARELTARFLGTQAGAVLAESIGINILRACARRLEQANIDVTVVLDNAHRLPANAVIAIVEAAPNVKFLLIAQPWPDQALIEARLQIRAERLEGWSQDDIAAEASARDCPVSREAAERIRHLTGGLPLYVQGAISIATSNYNRDAERFCDAIEAQTHAEETPQEVILQRIFEQLTENARRAAAILGLCDITLTNDEALAIVNIAISSPTEAARALRELRRNSILINFQEGHVGLHDALRPLAASARSLITSDLEQAILLRLYADLLASLAVDRSIPRLNFIFRLLPQIGQTETLVDLATNEMFHEQGDQRSLRTELENAANNTASSMGDRYWAHDALAYWESRDGGHPNSERLVEMRRLVEEGSLGEREQIGLCFKEIGAARDRETLERAYNRGLELTRRGTESNRMLRYNYAVILNRLRIFDRVIATLDPLIAEYFQFFGIREEALFMASNVQLRDMLPQPLDLGNIKHLGDALSLWSHARVGLDQPPMFRRIHAMKFYTVAQAGRSAASTGMECVDDFLVIMGDAVGAREIMEGHVLPLVEHFHLTELILKARSLYAIVLAWNGEIGNARRELRTLTEYLNTQEQAEMLAERSQHVEDIASRRVRLERQQPPPNALGMILNASQPQMRSASGRRPGRAPGRNDPCPCGSGQKFKRCHGR